MVASARHSGGSLLSKTPLVPSLGLLGEEPVPCELDMMDEMSARVRLPKGVEIPETSTIALWLTDPLSGTAVALPAYSAWPEEDGDDQVCDIYFAQPNALDAGNTAPADRRVDARVAPPAEEVEVWVVSDRAGREDVIECVLVDLGPGGMCVELTVGLEPSTPFTSGEFQVLLPGDSWPLVFIAQVRHRARVSREIVRYGLEFDVQRTVGFDAQQERLARFVQDRVQSIADWMRADQSPAPAA